jgi:Ran GTPase-activating protein (RanGAP) involved in mRNA processing and transport
LIIDIGQAKYTYKDMELMAYAIGENPLGTCGFKNLNLSKSPLTKEGAKLLAPALAFNKSIQHLDLSSTKIGVSGIVRIALALQKNTTLKSLNLYRNILDVDGARSIGELLKVNSTIEFLDVGHNRIRQTGLKAICDGILANPNTKLSQLAIRSNFINDYGIGYLFDNLVINRK